MQSEGCDVLFIRFRRTLGILAKIDDNAVSSLYLSKERDSRRMASRSYTAIVEKEGTAYVALCPELDVASQGERTLSGMR